MAQTVRVPDALYNRAESVAEEHEYSMKEAMRHIGREAGYDV